MLEKQLALPEKTNSEKAYRQLREDIVFGILLPNEKLKIETLREKYGFGAGPLREALSRLSSERLVILEGQRGFFVAPMSAEDAYDIGETRTLLEIEALRQSFLHGDDDWETQLVAAYHRLERAEQKIIQGETDFIEWESRNAIFHETMVAACPSAWIMRMRQQIYEQHQRYRHLSRKQSVGVRDIAAEHKALFDAAFNRDIEGATEIIRNHIARTTQTVLQTLKAQ
ncbi:GntR family transcriptional regulator [Paenochrobactrum sp. BZR 588]|uniref:GntR family transcriptional regulator n=1 Tax=Paenochrobactrum TaxID=999488 RepID=UPI0035BBE3E6